MTGTVGGYGTLGGTAGYGYGSPQQMMAQKLMEADKAPTANSSTESAATNTFAQGLKGAMGPGIMQSAQGQTPEWMNWIGKQFGGGADTTGIGSYPATPI